MVKSFRYSCFPSKGVIPVSVLFNIKRLLSICQVMQEAPKGLSHWKFRSMEWKQKPLFFDYWTFYNHEESWTSVFKTIVWLSMDFFWQKCLSSFSLTFLFLASPPFSLLLSSHRGHLQSSELCITMRSRGKISHYQSFMQMRGATFSQAARPVEHQTAQLKRLNANHLQRGN